MFFTGVAIAGGTLVAGSKVYRERKRKREMPWTYAAERLEKRRKKRQRRTSAKLITALMKGEQITPQGTPVRRSLTIRPFENEDGQQEQRLESANRTEEIEIYFRTVLQPDELAPSCHGQG